MFRPYCASFPAGLEALIRYALPRSRAAFLPGLAMLEGDDCPEVEPFAKNLFITLGLFQGPISSAAMEIARGRYFHDALRAAGGEIERDRGRAGSASHKGTFRIWPQVDNENVSPKGLRLDALERAIEGELALRFSDDAPERCFYLAERSEGFTLFLMRLSIEKPYECRKGQLSPEIARALCAVADLVPGSVVLDPFAGRGSIPLVAARVTGARAIAGEIDGAALEARDEYERVLGDFLAPGWKSPCAPDAIVTDPPWGLYSRLPDRDAAYRAIARRFTEELRPGAIAVTLLANDGGDSAFAHPALARDIAWPLLVNGKKALAVKSRRLP
jgi:hypothetical protein